VVILGVMILRVVREKEEEEEEEMKD